MRSHEEQSLFELEIRLKIIAVFDARSTAAIKLDNLSFLKNTSVGDTSLTFKSI
jgi:hypothetical protein